MTTYTFTFKLEGAPKPDAVAGVLATGAVMPTNTHTFRFEISRPTGPLTAPAPASIIAARGGRLRVDQIMAIFRDLAAGTVSPESFPGLLTREPSDAEES